MYEWTPGYLKGREYNVHVDRENNFVTGEFSVWFKELNNCVCFVYNDYLRGITYWGYSASVWNVQIPKGYFQSNLSILKLDIFLLEINKMTRY